MGKTEYLKENKKAMTMTLAIEEASRCLLCHDAPCSKACPAGTDPAKFIRSIRFRNFKGAAETIRTNNPLGGICARVCPYDKNCEGACSRCGIDNPIRIGELQRYLADFEKEMNLKFFEKTSLNKEKVAIIGSGPSGLTAAALLSQKGYKVSVFEEKSQPGGWLSYGIPPERLPQEVVDNEIGYIKELGVEFNTDCRVGGDIKIDDLRADGYKAFLIACGIQKSKKLNIEGIKALGVINGTDFLGEAKVKKGEIEVGKKVIVIGGGDVAMDCAATAKLLGAEDVKILYRRTIEKMPAGKEEREYIINTLKIPIFTGFKPAEILYEDGRVCGIRAEGSFDESELELASDMIIVAIGQEAEDINEIANIDEEDIFISGDIDEEVKEKTVVSAVASGKTAAELIDLYLNEKRKAMDEGSNNPALEVIK